MNSVLAVGMMSGTSMDGVDAALVETNGTDHVRLVDFLSLPQVLPGLIPRLLQLAAHPCWIRPGPRRDPTQPYRLVLGPLNDRTTRRVQRQALTARSLRDSGKQAPHTTPRPE